MRVVELEYYKCWILIDYIIRVLGLMKCNEKSDKVNKFDWFRMV